MRLYRLYCGLTVFILVSCGEKPQSNVSNYTSTFGGLGAMPIQHYTSISGLTNMEETRATVKSKRIILMEGNVQERNANRTNVAIMLLIEKRNGAMCVIHDFNPFLTTFSNVLRLKEGEEYIFPNSISR